MPSQSNRQSHLISSQENDENVEAKRRLALIEAIIELRYNDERRVPPSGNDLARMAASWDIHFERAEIPTDELVTLYYDAVANWDGKSIFTPSVMVSHWNKTKNTDYVEYSDIKCQVCNGAKIIHIYDWVNDSTLEAPCGCSN